MPIMTSEYADLLSFARGAPVGDVAKRLRALPSSARIDVQARAIASIRRGAEMRVESKRVSVVKLVIACLPETRPDLEAALQERRNWIDYEIHFTIFCFLDEVEDVPRARQYWRAIPRIVEHYLSHAIGNNRNSAWMAAELLGEDLPTKMGASALLRLARKALPKDVAKAVAGGIRKAIPRAAAAQRGRLERALAGMTAIPWLGNH